jgi:hypothetical protein
MLATSDLQRSIGHMTLGLSRAMDQRKHAADLYRECEREEQFQFPFSGQAGTFPVEEVMHIQFGVLFAFDSGTARDSELGPPHVRTGFEMTRAPTGLITYCHVKEWKQDNDLDYIGAAVVVGVHVPAVALQGIGDITSASQGVANRLSLKFTGVLHIAFQGWGAPLDPDGGGNAAGESGDWNTTATGGTA